MHRPHEPADLRRAIFSETSPYVDRKRGRMRGRWLGGKNFTLPELLQREKQERAQLATLFRWSARGYYLDKSAESTSPRGWDFCTQKLDMAGSQPFGVRMLRREVRCFSVVRVPMRA